MAVDLLLGLQWGDEGKGKIVDVLTDSYDVVARFQGDPNAGHTLEFDGIKHVLHTIPSGIFNPKVVNVIGNGVVIDPVVLSREIKELKSFDFQLKDRLLVSRKAHLIIPTHRLLDMASEVVKGKSKIGSTLKGISPTYVDKIGRNGLRIGDLESSDFVKKYQNLVDKHLKLLSFYDVDIDFNLEELEQEFFVALEAVKKLKFIDSEDYFHKLLSQNKKILAEGAQGAMLDVDFGTYPYVTSSNTTAAGACIGLGVSPKTISQVIGITKAYTTRVGSGPFPTELFDEVGEKICKVGREYGSTTGRKRRCGWIDLVQLKYAIRVSGVTQLMLMKADVLSGFQEIKVCVKYIYKGREIDYLPYDIESDSITPVYVTLKGWQPNLTMFKNSNEMPQELTDYVLFLEKELEVPIKLVSVGPDREQVILR